MLEQCFCRAREVVMLITIILTIHIIGLGGGILMEDPGLIGWMEVIIIILLDLVVTLSVSSKTTNLLILKAEREPQALSAFL